MKPSNRHKYPRRTAYIIAEYTVNEGTFRDIIKSIGAGGLFVRTSRKIGLGQSIKLEFPLFQFDQIIRVSGIVIRREPDGFAVAFDELLDDLIGKNGEMPEIVHESGRS
jgi:hypothetical protein